MTSPSEPVEGRQPPREPKFELRPIRGEDVNGETWVRIWDAQKAGPFDEGKVIAYSDRPTVVIQRRDGSHEHWVASLPWERIEAPTEFDWRDGNGESTAISRFMGSEVERVLAEHAVKPWQDRDVWATMSRAEPVMRDELIQAWSDRDTALAARDRARGFAADLEAENAHALAEVSRLREQGVADADRIEFLESELGHERDGRAEWFEKAQTAEALARDTVREFYATIDRARDAEAERDALREQGEASAAELDRAHELIRELRWKAAPAVMDGADDSPKSAP